MFRDKINLRLQKRGSVEPPRIPPAYGPDMMNNGVQMYPMDCVCSLIMLSIYIC